MDLHNSIFKSDPIGTLLPPHRDAGRHHQSHCTKPERKRKHDSRQCNTQDTAEPCLSTIDFASCPDVPASVTCGRSWATVQTVIAQIMAIRSKIPIFFFMNTHRFLIRRTSTGMPERHTSCPHFPRPPFLWRCPGPQQPAYTGGNSSFR